MRFVLFLALLTACLLALPTAARAQDCTSPTADAGAVAYNGDHDVFQGCAENGWQAFHNVPYVPNAVEFDGGNDWLIGRPGSGSGTKATISFWFRNNNPPSHQQIIGDNGHDNITLNYVPIYDSFVIRFGDNAGSNHLDIRVNTDVDDADWHHVLVSFDLTDTNKRHVYIDGVLDSTSWNTYNTGGTLDFATTEDITFSRRAPNNNARHVNGDMADFWIDFGTYIDLSIASNREKFIDADGKPVDLGSDGSRPTGSAPEMFLSGDTDSWHTNKGTGGGFTKNGTLTDAASTPSIPPGPLEGLVGWWKLDETGGTTASDAIGSTDGTFENSPAWAPSQGVIDGAIRLDEDDSDYIDIPSLLGEPANVTLAAWVNLSEFGDVGSQPITMGDVVSLELRPGLLRGNGFIGGFTWKRTDYNDSSILNGGWVHLALVWDDANDVQELYKNGSLVHTTFHTESLSWTRGSNTRIGRHGTGDEKYNFGGAVDDVRVYDRALDATEIQRIYDYGYPCKNPTGKRGEVIYNGTHDAFQGCTPHGWYAFHTEVTGSAADPCAPSNAPAAGQACDDGSTYAGITADGSGEPMYIMASDKTGLPWNNGNNTGFVNTDIRDNDTGEVNTSELVSIDADINASGFQPHQMAHYCSDLSPPDPDALGHSDWYLPAYNEMVVVYDNLVDEDGDNDPATPTPGVEYGLTVAEYFTSSERDVTVVRPISLSSGAYGSTLKHHTNRRFICARKGYEPPPTCSNPDGRPGEITYTTHDVFQGCAGTGEWIAFGQVAP